MPAAVIACQRFFTLELGARIISGTLSVLKMASLDEDKGLQKFLSNTAAAVVDKFVTNQVMNKQLVLSIMAAEQNLNAQRYLPNA